MSLSYIAEHLAWQQRIQRESFSSRRFHQYSAHSFLENQKAVGRSWSASQTNGLPPSNPNLLRDEPFHHISPKHEVVSDFPYGLLVSPSKDADNPKEHLPSRYFQVRKSLTLHRGPAEVRGKYAPPPPHQPDRCHSADRKTLGLSRPATAGMLKRKLVDTAVQVKTDASTQRKAIVLSSRTKSATSTRGRARSRALVDTSIHNTEPAPVEQTLTEAVVAERPGTANTSKTTLTQRMYVEELERLLQEERRRRVLAEAKLLTCD